MKILSFIFTLIAVFISNVPAIRATPDSLDLTFGDGGKVVTNIGEGNTKDCRLSKAVRQPDGKYVMVGGISNDAARFDFGIARFNTDGSLDQSFGENGKVITPLDTEDDFARDVSIQNDGKIVVVGYGYNYSGNSRAYLTIVRYNVNGTLDNSFDSDGILQTDFTIFSLVGNSVEIQPDGKIITAGTSGSNSSIFAARFNSDGTPDFSFGGTGLVTYRIGTNQYNNAVGMALQSDGKIITAGSTKTTVNSSNSLFQVSRLNTDGTIDTSFNNSGWTTTNFNGNVTNYATAVAVQSDGQIVAVGTTNNNLPNSDFALLRLNVNGTFDSTFDGDGKLTTHIETTQTGVQSDDRAFDVGTQADGKIFAAGYARIEGYSYLTLVKYNQNGSLDTTFDNDGKLRMSARTEQFPLNGGLVIHGDNKIALVGETDTNARAFSMARFNLDGTPDSAFGGIPYGGGIPGPGIAKTFFGKSSDQSSSIAIQLDGKFLLGGISDQFLSIARFNIDGSLDNSFADQGRKKLVLPTSYPAYTSKILIQPDGKILVAGYAVFGVNETSQEDFLIIRLNANGSFDTSFDNDGIAVTNFGNGSRDFAYGAALQDDGKIVLVGTTNFTPSDVTGFAVIRYNPNGSLDNSFDGDGKAVYTFAYLRDEGKQVAIQPNGKIMVAGTIAGQDFGIVSLNQDGTIDISFNGTGYVSTDVNNLSVDFVNDFVRQRDGKLLLVGTTASGNILSIALVKHNADGTLDTNFGNSGKSIQPLATTSDKIEKLAVQQDGKILVVGKSVVNSSANFCIYRFNEDGVPDITFGNNGKLVFDFLPNGDDEAKAVAVQQNGRILVSGYLGQFLAKDFAVIRLFGNPTRLFNSFFDFDGDGKSDISVFRPDNGAWYLQQSQAGFAGVAFGISTDKLVPADYDGDGKTDVAVVRNGVWYLQRSQSGFAGIQFGAADDVPVPADYDGDGKAELAVFRPANGYWYLLNLTTNQFTATLFGNGSDKPVPADYDGDGKTDLAVNRGGNWYLQRSQLGFTGIQFGDGNDKTVPADYDGDGKADIAVFRPSTGAWYLLQSQAGFTGQTFGLGTDIPAPADYDGDGKADLAVVRNGNWYLNRTSAGFIGIQFGTATDKPLPNVFVR